MQSELPVSDNPVNPPLLVGVDGSKQGLHALDWAAEVAVERHWPLRLVNAYEPYWALMAFGGIPGLDAERDSMSFLAQAREHLGGQAANLDVTTVSLMGPVVPSLLAEVARSRMLVVGRRGAGRFAALLLGSTALECAARAVRPVVVLPPAFLPASARATVVVGVDGADSGQSAVEFAFAEASFRRAHLTVVHASLLPSPYGIELEAFTGRDAWLVEQEVSVAEALAGWRTIYPDVTVRIVIEEDHAAAALVRHAAEADLVVVGGRGHSAFTDLLIGSTARAVIEHALCPVAVVHQVADGASG